MKWNNKIKFRKYNSTRSKNAKSVLCHAPTKSLLFVQGGKIMACHYNRGYMLGIYPENSIEDVIKGTKIKELQSTLNNYSFPKSCWYCQQEIENQRFYQAGCKKYDYLIENENKNVITSLEFQTSNQCNLECIMCTGEYSSLIRSNREKGEAYINPYDDAFVEQVIPLLKTAKFASFTGGEPFLNPIYYKIWDKLIDLKSNIQITISTNGTIFNEKIREYFEKLNMSITLSIDSLNKSEYEKIRQGASFEKVMNNIESFMEIHHQKNKLFSIKTVLMEQNINNFHKLFQFFNEKHTQIYPKLVWAPVDLSLRFFEKKKLLTIIENLKKHSFSNNDDIQKFNIIRYHEIIETLSQWGNENVYQSLEDYLSKSTNELSEILFHFLKEHILNDEMIEHEKRELLLMNLSLMKKIIREQITDENFHYQLSHILTLPRPLIINEFYRMNIEKFFYRLYSLKKDN